jgi:hypothetical protein
MLETIILMVAILFLIVAFALAMIYLPFFLFKKVSGHNLLYVVGKMTGNKKSAYIVSWGISKAFWIVIFMGALKLKRFIFR